MKYTGKILATLLLSFLFFSCHKEKLIEPTPTTPVDHGHVVFKFAYYVDTLPAVWDSMMYINAAGNHYQVNNVQYFISNVTLHKSDGTSKLITSNSIYYIDSDISSTLTWYVSDDIPIGSYNSISFTFGIDSVHNISNIFVNPPESDMFWPEPMGGGYHMMKLNGKYIDTASVVCNFNTHIGKGRVIVGSDTTMVNNSFTANLLSSSFTVTKDATKEIEIIMNIDSWYKTPNIYDHNVYGGSIMNNQTAMGMLVQNGFDVFTIGYIH